MKSIYVVLNSRFAKLPFWYYFMTLEKAIETMQWYVGHPLKFEFITDHWIAHDPWDNTEWIIAKVDPLSQEMMNNMRPQKQNEGA